MLRLYIPNGKFYSIKISVLCDIRKIFKKSILIKNLRFCIIIIPKSYEQIGKETIVQKIIRWASLFFVSNGWGLKFCTAKV